MSLNVFLTGANRGIGLKFCEKLLEKENQVFATTRSIENSYELKKLHLKHEGRLHLLELDCADSQSILGLSSKIKHLSHLDLLINNAGVFSESNRAPLREYSKNDFLESFQVNTFAPLEITTALLPKLILSKNPKVVHITSLMGSITDNTSGGFYAYRMSKAALNMFHKSFSIDYPNILSLVLHPGWVQTDMGGKDAHITTEVSVNGLLSVIESTSLKESGSFYNYNGQKLPW